MGEIFLILRKIIIKNGRVIKKFILEYWNIVIKIHNYFNQIYYFFTRFISLT